MACKQPGRTWNLLGACAVCLLLLCGCRERIVHDLSEAEANRMLAELYAASARPAKVQQPDGRWAIAVPKSEALWAMKYMEDSRLLRDAAAVPAPSSMLASREEQRFLYERSLSREVEVTLSNIENILQARVHLNLPARDPFLGRLLPDTEPGSASVLMIANEQFRIPIEDVKQLVAGAAGINPANVAVMISTTMPRNVNAGANADLQKKDSRPFPDRVSLWNSFSHCLDGQILLSALIILMGAVSIFGSVRAKRARKCAALAQVLTGPQK